MEENRGGSSKPSRLDADIKKNGITKSNSVALKEELKRKGSKTVLK